MLDRARKQIVIHDDFSNLVHDTTGTEDAAGLAEAARVLLGAEADLISFRAADGERCEYWPSRVGEYMDANKEGTSRTHKVYRALTSAGVDPFGTVVNAVRQGGGRVLGKVRVNDVHHVGGHPSRAALATQFWRDHPEWWIGTVEARGGGSPTFRDCDRIGPMERHGLAYGRPFVLDYAVPEVRKHRLAVMREFMERYPLAGLTLNFIREQWCVSFPDQNAPLLTEFVAGCRRVVEETVRQRGEEPILGAIVPWDLEYCRVMGLEVEDWIRSGLLDYVSPTPSYVSKFGMPVEDWTKLASGTGCAVYPGIIGYSSCRNEVCVPEEYEEQTQGPERAKVPHTSKVTPENVRALAHGFYKEGADGVSFFNFYSACYQTLYPLSELCVPERMQGGERHYVYLRKSPYAEWEFLKLVFPPGCLGRQAVTCRVHEDLGRAEAHVRFKARGLEDIRSLIVDLNGKEIPESDLSLIPHDGEGFLYVQFGVNEDMLRDGDNEIGFAYRAGCPVFQSDVIVQEVEIRVAPR